MQKETVVPIVVVVLAILFLDPFMVLMPSNLVYFLLGGLLVTFSVYALHILREIPADEREEAHRAYAGRMAYITGSGVLVLGIMYQVLVVHAVEPILVLALATMTVTKYASLYVARRNS